MKGQDQNENKSGNVPIPLKNANDQKNQDDILDDYLREQKRAEKMNKLEQMEQQLMDQHIQAEKKKLFDRYMKQNKDKQLAYDFDGNFVVQNRKAQPIKHQSNQPEGLNVKVNMNKLKETQKEELKKFRQLKQLNQNTKNIIKVSDENQQQISPHFQKEQIIQNQSKNGCESPKYNTRDNDIYLQ
ncbi:hypothetical protein PPERSA_05745 [Pseudocohnilembus persalinus]|uniref:Uncharacterized protein n=1 Tax=Pseudocohnilembus persalinus TaxID=266149 RepID=A0A0V0QI72_PSEPJ|nr:hypothetical protein PPERSA_05745 [Pseudocohnilembus persalinus]|eukprot:KRX01906.1 hypothetical protein PPERSA_05745 [Pseudocohnilembus persalinus]